MRKVSRKTFVGACALGAAGSLLPQLDTTAAESGRCSLSFSTYGLKPLATEDAISLVAEIGYDGIEITVWPDWDAAPANMPPERRTLVRQLIEDNGLILDSLMENLVPAEDDAEHAAHLERLRGVTQLAIDLAPDAPPLIQTVLGGGTWDEKRDLFLKRLPGWVEVGKSAGVPIAIKPHRGGGLSRPDEAVWLIETLDAGPWLRMVYDYSHYAFRDMTIDGTVEESLPYIGHVAVKDAVQEGDKVRFKLPGESGEIDYAHLIRLLHDVGYRGDICCEISAQVWNAPEYNPIDAAKICYANMSAAFAQAGV